MADEDVIYRLFLREATVVAEKVGIWVFYKLRDTKNIEHEIGYMMGRVDDFERRKIRSRKDSRRLFLKDRMSAWNRALRMIQKVKGAPYRELCARLISDWERDPHYKHLKYVSAHEVESDEEDRAGKLKAKPKRANGRPRRYTVRPVDFRTCEQCKGGGFFRI